MLKFICLAFALCSLGKVLALIDLPAQKVENKQLPFSILKATLGKKPNGKEVRTLGRLLKIDPIISYSMWNEPIAWDKGEDDIWFFLIWKTQGITLNVYEGTVSMVTIYNSKPEGYRRYLGEIPEELFFEDDIESTQKKLGKPEELTILPARKVKGSMIEWEEVWLDYSKKKGLEVILRRPKDGKWAIDCIKIWLPKK